MGFPHGFPVIVLWTNTQPTLVVIVMNSFHVRSRREIGQIAHKVGRARAVIEYRRGYAVDITHWKSYWNTGNCTKCTYRIIDVRYVYCVHHHRFLGIGNSSGITNLYKCTNYYGTNTGTGSTIHACMNSVHNDTVPVVGIRLQYMFMYRSTLYSTVQYLSLEHVLCSRLGSARPRRSCDLMMATPS
eukprot:COSAG02_NODE_1909_length_10419_cov_238.761725_6_plen_186_part_00